MRTSCKGCGADIYFMKTKNDKLIPVDMKTIDVIDRVAMDNGRDVLFDSKRGHISHFATCPKAERFRRNI